MTPAELLAYVEAHRDQPCPYCRNLSVFEWEQTEEFKQTGLMVGREVDPHCNYTGQVPRPEMVALWGSLTTECLMRSDTQSCYRRADDGEFVDKQGGRWTRRGCSRCGGTGRIPRSNAEMHVALENWLGEQDFTIIRHPDGASSVYRKNKIPYYGPTLWEAARAAIEAMERETPLG